MPSAAPEDIMAPDRPYRLLLALGIAIAVLGGCPAEDPPELPVDEIAPEGLPIPFGLLNVLETPDHAEVHAVFAATLPTTGVIDGLSWLGVGDLANGYWMSPEEPGELVPVSQLECPFPWIDDLYLDVGEQVEVGGIVASRVQGWTDPDGFSDDGLIYYRDEGGHLPGELGTINHVGFSWPGGEDVDAESRPGIVDRIDAMELSSHVHGQAVQWFEDDDVVLEWVAAAGGEVTVSVLGDRRWFHARVPEGDSSITLPSALLLDAVLDAAEIRVGRSVREVVDAAGSEIHYRYTREQRLSLQRTGPLSAAPDVVRLDALVELTVTHHDGTFEAGDTTFDLGPGIQVLSTEVQPDGETAAVRIEVAPEAGTGPRDLSVTTPDGTRISERAIRVLLPRADACADAFTLPGPGTYHGRLDGLADDHSDTSACTGYAAEGPDSFFRLAIAGGELMAATLHYPEVDAVVYLAGDCAALGQPLACADAGGLSAAETLSFTPLPDEGGEFVLVADVFGALDSPPDMDYELVVELLGP